MVGADVTHLCSVLLKYGHSHITDLQALIIRWLEDLEYNSVAEIKGSASQDYAIDPAALEHRAKSAYMIVYIEPVTYVFTLAIYGKRLP